MRYPIRMQITDPKSALSDVDQHQVENMIWLRLSPIKEMISIVKLEIKRLDHGKFGRKHVVTISTRLESGHVVKSCTARIAKAAVLMASVNHMKASVERRVRFESGRYYQFIRWTKNAARSLSQPIRNLIRMPEQNGSSPAS